MNGRSSVTLIFIILILKFNNEVNQLLTHVGTHCWPNVTSLLWVIHTPQRYMQLKPSSVHIKWCMRWQTVDKLFLHYSGKLVGVIQWQTVNIHHHTNCDQTGVTKGCTIQTGCILYLLHTNQSPGCWVRTLTT